MLFKNRKRDYHGIARQSESTYSFLDRSARLASEKVRNILESWFSDYPENEQKKLQSRFRNDFESAFFELMLYALFRCRGCEVDPHPEINPDSTRHPDFLVAFPDGKKFILEATVTKDESPEEKKKRKILATFYDDIDREAFPNFWLLFRKVTGVENVPSSRLFIDFMHHQLAKLNPDRILTGVRSGKEKGPSIIYTDGPFQIEVVALPRDPKNRGKGWGGSIGTYPAETRWGGTNKALLKALKPKASRYGKPMLPYVIAVNSLSPWGTNIDDIFNCLLGVPEPPFPLNQNSNNRTRTLEILWLGPKGCRNTRVSAVIVGMVSPWNLPRADIRIYHNPFAAYPCDIFPWPIPQACFLNDNVQWRKGLGLGESFKLPTDWPGKLFND